MLAFILPLLELLDKLSQGCQFLLVHQVELVDEVYEVLEAGVQVSLCREQHNVLEVCMVYVRVHSKQALKDHLYDIDEVFREGHA